MPSEPGKRIDKMEKDISRVYTSEGLILITIRRLAEIYPGHFIVRCGGPMVSS